MKQWIRAAFALVIFLTHSPMAGSAPVSEAVSRASQSGMIPETVRAKRVLLNLVDTNPTILNPQLDIIRGLAGLVKVVVITDLMSEMFVKQRLTEENLIDKVEFLEMNDVAPASTWARDFAPVQIRDEQGKLGLVKFRYLKDEQASNTVAASLAAKLKLPIRKINLFLEPGNLMADDKGNIFVSERLIENSKVTLETLNPELKPLIDSSVPILPRNRQELETVLLESLKGKKVVWLPALDPQIEGTGHVDLMAKIMNSSTAVVSDSDTPSIKRVLDKVATIMKKSGYQNIVRIKNASNRFRATLLSYTNALLVGGTVLVPKFGEPTDQEAAKAYTDIGLKVLQVSGDSIQHGGSVHCLTYQY